MTLALTVFVVLVLGALIMAIASAAGKGGPLMIPVAIILLSIALFLTRYPAG